MAFKGYVFSESHKIRVGLSANATKVIENDATTFGIKSFSDCFNIVITNFRENAIASKTLFLQRKEREILDSLENCDFPEDVRTQVCKALLAREEEKADEKLAELSAKEPNDVYLPRYINMDNIDYLENECLEDAQGTTYKTPGMYLKCIIEEYCELPFHKRERIIRKDVFDLIEDAISVKDCLKIKAETKEDGLITCFTCFVKPYKIITDPLSEMSYLVCKSRRETAPGSPSEEMKIASFALNRMNKPKRIKSESSRFTAEEEKEIKERLLKTPPAYLFYGEGEEIHIKLTDEGKRKYQNLLFSRPVKDKERSTKDEYVFFCTVNQARNYFFGFGSDAEVISPPNLRDWFARDYRNANAKCQAQ